MKKQFYFALLLMFSLSVLRTPLMAQDQIPAALQSAVTELFPNAKDIEWDNQADEYTVYLMDKAYNVEITFDDNNKWELINTYQSFEDLPEAAQIYLAENHNTSEFNNVIHMRTPTRTMFLVNFETETQMINLAFDEQGNLIEKQVEDIDGE
jgi:Putative beta-lactamase-inhibitor-like, PepSY-like